MIQQIKYTRPLTVTTLNIFYTNGYMSEEVLGVEVAQW